MPTIEAKNLKVKNVQITETKNDLCQIKCYVQKCYVELQKSFTFKKKVTGGV